MRERRSSRSRPGTKMRAEGVTAPAAGRAGAPRTRNTRSLMAPGCIDFGDRRSSSPCGSCASGRTCSSGCQRALPVHARRRVPGHEPRAVRAREAAGRPHSRNVACVGDDDQAIYRWRGAAISNVLAFLDRYPEARQVVLTENYRSHQKILDAADRLIVYNNPDRLEVRSGISKHLIAVHEPDGPAPMHLHYETGTQEADAVAQAIREKVDAGSWRLRRRRDPRPLQRRRRPVPALAQPPGHPVDVLG